MAVRYAARLPAFLRSPMTSDDARRLVESQYERRATTLVETVRRGVFESPGSPYRPLFDASGLGFEDFRRLVENRGVEDALREAGDRGVRVTLAQFKGRRPIVAAGKTFDVLAEDFDNPLASPQFEGRTGGSSGRPRRLLIDLDLLESDSAAHRLFLDAFELSRSPFAVFRPVPPDNSGIKKLLHHARLGLPVARWFTQNRPPLGLDGLRYRWFTAFTRRAVSWRGLSAPAAEFTPPGREERVARWLAECRAGGAPAHLDTIVSSALRVCRAATAAGLDISGTFFRVGGERLSPARRRVIEDTGSRAAPHYSMSECGPVAVACAGGQHGDMHLLLNKVAIVTRVSPGGGSGRASFDLSALHASSPKLMINVEVGDSGEVSSLECGCPLAAAGLRVGLRDVRAERKLTGEGVLFLEDDIEELIDVTLPAAFGGAPSDYQFVEDEDNGKSRIRVLASPRLGPLDESSLLQTVLKALRGRSVGHALMTEIWERAGAVAVVRADPECSPSGKVPALRILRND